MKKTDEEKLQAYLEKIESFFHHYHRLPYSLSPREVQLVLQWYEEGVPVQWIIQSLEELFQSAFRGKKAPPSLSLIYLQKALNNKIKALRASMAGKSSVEKTTLLMMWEEYMHELDKTSPLYEVVLQFIQAWKENPSHRKAYWEAFLFTLYDHLDEKEKPKAPPKENLRALADFLREKFHFPAFPG